MKQHLLRMFRGVYLVIRAIFFLSFCLISLQLAQLESLRLLDLKLSVKPSSVFSPLTESEDEMATIPELGLEESDSRYILMQYQQQHLWQRPIWLLKQPYSDLQRVYDQYFYPAIPLTLSAVVYAFYGLLCALLLWWLLTGIVLSMNRSIRRKQVDKLNTNDETENI